MMCKGAQYCKGDLQYCAPAFFCEGIAAYFIDSKGKFDIIVIDVNVS